MERNKSPRRSTRGRLRDAKTGHLLPFDCGSFSAGHTVHFIQSRQSSGQPHRRGKLIEVDGFEITIDFDDEIKTFKNHDPQRLLEIVKVGRCVHVCEELVILRSSYGYLFSVAGPDLPWVPCGLPLGQVT